MKGIQSFLSELLIKFKNKQEMEKIKEFLELKEMKLLKLNQFNNSEFKFQNDLEIFYV